MESQFQISYTHLGSKGGLNRAAQSLIIKTVSTVPWRYCLGILSGCSRNLQPQPRFNVSDALRTRSKPGIAVAFSGSSSSKVLNCIGQQSGSADLSSDPQLGKIGLQGFLLAGCITNSFGFTPPDALGAAEFPQTIALSGS